MCVKSKEHISARCFTHAAFGRRHNARARADFANSLRLDTHELNLATVCTASVRFWLLFYFTGNHKLTQLAKRRLSKGPLAPARTGTRPRPRSRVWRKLCHRPRLSPDTVQAWNRHFKRCNKFTSPPFTHWNRSTQLCTHSSSRPFTHRHAGINVSLDHRRWYDCDANRPLTARRCSGDCLN